MFDTAHITGLDVFFAMLALMILCIVYLLIQLITAIVLFKSKGKDIISIVDFITEVSNNVKGKK